MNNREWLYSLDVADLADWFDAEHVETEERALDGDTEPENEDSRERLEAEIESYSAFDMMDTITLDMVIGWIDRQAAITERECRKPNWSYCETCEALEKLTAERDKLQAQLYELTADCDMLENERDNLEADCKDWMKHAMAAENVCYETKQEREQYRKLFGMALDWAHEITMLESSIDEGMA